ncbi:SPOR domain-containing protein [Hasllibacter sp. MH4015]|uniref:SPOR domain-containing protein n=1 Tax=Hasllibacter sp. MH4015 TaxID=2854029 RepID=UPI001CD2A914|nr:SPOR domain-containing protein [Hasllibacter sp. MH4015]
MTPFLLKSRLRLGLILVPVLALAACMEEGEFNFGSRNADADGPAPIGATRLVERDVEAPEIFEVTAEGLWDGRPSLGGVWVAHPDVTDPERVIIRNDENGRFVIGALFRRERENPGPDLQISSDAAAALGALAGDPTMLNVTALRREEVAENADAAPDATAPGEAIAASALPGEITSAPLDGAEDIASAAAAAIDAAEPAPQPTAARTPASALDQAYVQIGIFSVQENATNTGQALRSVGLEPTIYDQSTNGRQFWRVVVGPADTEETRTAILENVRELGFDDAFFVSR